MKHGPIWKKRLSPLSKIHIRNVCTQLRNLKMDSEKPIGDFLLHAKSTADSLAAARSPISDSELIDYIIDALGVEYKDFITSLHLRPKNSFDDFYDLFFKRSTFLKGWHFYLYLLEPPLLLPAFPKIQSPLPISPTKISVITIPNRTKIPIITITSRSKISTKTITDIVGGVVEEETMDITQPPHDNRPPLLLTLTCRPFHFSPHCQMSCYRRVGDWEQDKKD